MIAKSLFNRLGKSATVTKSTGATTTGKVALTHPENIDVMRRAFMFKFSSPSGLLVSGDLFGADGSNYIVATTESNYFGNTLTNNTGVALRCNANISVVRYMGSDSGFVTQAGTIKACLSSTKLYALDDRSMAVDEAGRRRSSEPRYYCYVRKTEDVQEKDTLIDGTRTLGVLYNIDPYFAQGVNEISIIIED